MIKYPAYKCTEKHKWVNKNDFKQHVQPPRGSTKSVWGQTKEMTGEPYYEGFETIGHRMRERQKTKERGGPFLTGLNMGKARVQTSFDSSRTSEATLISPLQTPSSRVYKNSLEGDITKLWLT